MITEAQIESLRGATVVDSDGDRVGKAGEVYLDDQTGQPTWLTVNTGLFGTSESFVPLETATFEGDELRVTYDKAKIKDAPRVATDGHLDLTEEDALFEYYGLQGGQTSQTGSAGQTGTAGYAEGTSGRDEVFDQERTGTAGYAEGTTTGRAESGTTGYAGRERDDLASGRTTGHDTSGPTTDDAMTRSEESLRVGTQAREAGRARLRKYVVTEQQSVTVPVSHEEVRLEREPITEANAAAAGDGPAISEEEHEVVLHEEVPVVAKEVNAVERVRLGTETVTEQQTVSDEVRKEQIDLTGAEEKATAGRSAGTTTERERGDRI